VPWFKVDDGMPEHPKLEVIEGDPARYMAAITVWTIMGADCARRLTDGFVSTARLGKVLGFLGRAANDGADALVEARLWDATEGGWRFHAWNEYQPSKEDVEQERKASADRVRKWRQGQKGKGHVTALPTAQPTVLPTPLVTAYETALVTAPPRGVGSGSDRISPDPESDAREVKAKIATDPGHVSSTSIASKAPGKPVAAFSMAFGMAEAQDAANEARRAAGLAEVIHMNRDEQIALVKYAERTAAKYADAAKHVRAAHAAWIAGADDWERKRGLKFWDWLKSPDAALVKLQRANAERAKRRADDDEPPPPIWGGSGVRP